MPSWAPSVPPLVRCVPLSGALGRSIVAVVAIATVLLYAAKYVTQRWRGSERRTFRVFAFDVSKILIGGSVAWVVLIVAALLLGRSPDDAADGATLASQHVATVSNEPIARHPLQPIAWYLPALILESTLGTVIGLGFGRAWTSYCRRRWRRELKSRTSRQPAAASTEGCWRWFTIANMKYGRYNSLRFDAYMTVTSEGEESAAELTAQRHDAEPLVSWWLAQLASWCCCIGMSRLAVVACIYIVNRVVPQRDNPLFALAAAVDSWDAPCVTKQIFCFGVARLAIDLAVIAVTDQWNRLKVQRPAMGGDSSSDVELATYST